MLLDQEREKKKRVGLLQESRSAFVVLYNCINVMEHPYYSNAQLHLMNSNFPFLPYFPYHTTHLQLL